MEKFQWRGRGSRYVCQLTHTYMNMKNLHKLFILNSAATQRTNCAADSFHPGLGDDDSDQYFWGGLAYYFFVIFKL